MVICSLATTLLHPLLSHRRTFSTEQTIAIVSIGVLSVELAEIVIVAMKQMLIAVRIVKSDLGNSALLRGNDPEWYWTDLA